MKIPRKHLRRIIREEISDILEQDDPDSREHDTKSQQSDVADDTPVGWEYKSSGDLTDDDTEPKIRRAWQAGLYQIEEDFVNAIANGKEGGLLDFDIVFKFAEAMTYNDMFTEDQVAKAMGSWIQSYDYPDRRRQ